MEVLCFNLFLELKVGYSEAENPEKPTLWTTFLLVLSAWPPLQPYQMSADAQLWFPKTHA